MGVLYRSGRYAYLVPREGSLHRDVLVPSDARGGAREGDVVVARVTDWGSEHLDPVGEVLEVLGRVGDPGVDILAIVHTHELAREFPQNVIADAEEIRSRTAGGVELEGRADFRESLTFTIDPADAKDHDDAISIQRLRRTFGESVFTSPTSPVSWPSGPQSTQKLCEGVPASTWSIAYCRCFLTRSRATCAR